MMKKIKIRLTKNKEEFLNVLDIRKKVFIKEQGVALDVEVDRLDPTSKHVMVMYDEKVVGCARFRFYENRLKVQRVAILKTYRGKGLGKKLMKYSTKYANKRKLSEVFFEAQYYAIGFYEKIGFKIRGKPFIEKETGIKYIEMYMKI